MLDNKRFINNFAFQMDAMNRKLKLDELGRLSALDFKNTEKNKLILVLDDIRSMHNIGSIFRTSDAFLVEAIYLCGITAQPPHREIEKTALGATDSVHWEYFESIDKAMDNLKAKGYEIYALEQTSNSKSLVDMPFKASKSYALIFGNEVMGVSQAAIDQSDAVIEIPQFGTKHSFNISVTVGIVLWDYFSKINQSS